MSDSITDTTDAADNSTDAVRTAPERALAAEIDALRERIDRLEDELERLTTDAGDGTDASTTEDPREWLDVPADHRDAAVVEMLTPGETYAIRDLRSAYSRETDIRASETLADRVRTLVDAAAFERVGRSRRWRYQPPARDGDATGTDDGEGARG